MKTVDLADIDLDIVEERMRAENHFQGKGKKANNVAFGRELTEGDLVALSVERTSKPEALKRIHSSHHALAKCIAAGMKSTQASLVTGYSNQRIYQLSQDPAFTALVEDYKTESRSIFADLAERMSGVSLDALELLHERMQDRPEEFSPGMLLDVVKTFADRTGHGPGQDVNISLRPDAFIDRPPREDYAAWQARRAAELIPEPKALPAPAPKGPSESPMSPQGTTDLSKLN